MNRARLCFLTVLLLACASVIASAAARPNVLSYDESIVTNVPAGVVLSGPEDAQCDAREEGALRYSVKRKALMLCDGKQWKALKAQDVETPR